MKMIYITMLVLVCGVLFVNAGLWFNEEELPSESSNMKDNDYISGKQWVNRSFKTKQISYEDPFILKSASAEYEIGFFYVEFSFNENYDISNYTDDVQIYIEGDRETLYDIHNISTNIPTTFLQKNMNKKRQDDIIKITSSINNSVFKNKWDNIKDQTFYLFGYLEFDSNMDSFIIGFGSNSTVVNYSVDGGQLVSNTVNDVHVEQDRYYIATDSEIVVFNTTTNTHIANISNPYIFDIIDNQFFGLDLVGGGIYMFDLELNFNTSNSDVPIGNDVDCERVNGEIICGIATTKGFQIYNTSSNTVYNYTSNVASTLVKYDNHTGEDRFIFYNGTDLLASTNLSNVVNGEEYQYEVNMSGWWHLDNADGNDSSDEDLDIISLSAGAFYNESGCKFGGCLYFNGTASNRATVNDSDDKFDDMKELTVMFWAKSNDNPNDASYDMLVGKYGSSTTTDRSWNLQHRDAAGTGNDRLVPGLVDQHGGVYSSEIVYDGVFNDFTWHHIAMTINFNVGNLTVYFDGENQGAIEGLNTSSKILNGSTLRPVTIGCLEVSCSGYNGSIDELAIFDRAWSGQEIYDYYNNFVDKDNIPFENVTSIETKDDKLYIGNNHGLNVLNNTLLDLGNEYITTSNTRLWLRGSSTDISGNEFNGDSTGGAGLNATGSKWESQAMTFGTGDDYVNGSDLLLSTSTTQYSVSLWTKPEKSPSYGYFEMRRVAAGGGFAMYATASNNRPNCQNQNGSGQFQTVQNPVDVPVDGNTWIHITCDWNGTHMRLFINGVETTKVESRGTFYNEDFADWRLGTTVGRGFNGTIHEVRVLNKSQTNQEIYMNYIGKAYAYNGYDNLLAGTTNNVSALSWNNHSSDTSYLEVGTNDGVGGGGLTVLDIVNDVHIKNYTSGNNENIIAYNVTSVSHVSTSNNGTEYNEINYTLVGTLSGASKIIDYGISAKIEINVTDGSNPLSNANISCNVDGSAAVICSELTNSTGQITCDNLDTSKLYDCTATKTTYSADNTIDDISPTFQINSISDGQINMTLQVGKFTIEVSDYNNNSLEGVQVDIKYTNGTDIESITTNSSGIVESSDLSLITYDLFFANYSDFKLNSRTPPQTIYMFDTVVFCNYTDGRNVNEGTIEVFSEGSNNQLVEATTNSSGQAKFILENTTNYNFYCEDGNGNSGSALQKALPSNIIITILRNIASLWEFAIAIILVSIPSIFFYLSLNLDSKHFLIKLFFFGVGNWLLPVNMIMAKTIVDDAGANQTILNILDSAYKLTIFVAVIVSFYIFYRFFSTMLMWFNGGVESEKRI